MSSARSAAMSGRRSEFSVRMTSVSMKKSRPPRIRGAAKDEIATKTVRMTTAKKVGATTGRTTRRRIVHSPAPSDRAASMVA